MKNYRVWLRSVPGPYEQYNGKVDVVAEDRESAIQASFRKLSCGAFPDRPPRMWCVDSVEEMPKDRSKWP